MRFGVNSTVAFIEGVDSTDGLSSYQPMQVGGSTVALTIANTPRLQVGTTGTVTVNGFTAASVGLIVKGAASQAGSIQEWQNSAGTRLVSVASNGQINADNNIYAAAAFVGTNRIGTAHLSVASQYFGNPVAVIQGITSQSATVLTVKAGASQTSNSQEWQASGGSVLTAINASGTINFASGNTSATATAGAVTAPALVVGFITMQVAGTTVKVPYYAN